ncbi:hypothetical protein B0A52_07842 [Exophiala mesophila]|uniref:Phosphatidylinositol N-acetylglucosaminyltransferase subunit H conserved domain-containing protein n=1 Tax=Exophiala mesophila TaxID=212818 RepID=A0A438MVC9_EXOME|nr:hypothetical protein B0A52_07842 [Exophiala mesophila]
MFSRSTQYLDIYCPSPTTVSFTVNTRPRSTRKEQLLALVRHVLRVILILHVVLVTVAKLGSGTVHDHVQILFRASLIGQGLVRRIAESTEWWLLVPLGLLIVYLCLRRDYVQESLLVLQGLGIQTSTSSAYYFLPATSTFIPTTQIQDIVIHEAFKGLEVRYYLAVIVENATDVLVVFPSLLPRRELLEQVWRGSRKCLYSGMR